MALGYGLPEDTEFEVGQVYNKPVGDDFEPRAVVIAAVLPWKGVERALLIFHDAGRPAPDRPRLETALHAMEWWLPWRGPALVHDDQDPPRV